METLFTSPTIAHDISLQHLSEIKMDEDHLVQDEKHCHFTVFIRLPFPRGDFVDPPPVSTTITKGSAWTLTNIHQIDWDSSKDRALWDILSRAPKGREADCTNFSTFHVL